jgi:two-component system response regulator AtoC
VAERLLHVTIAEGSVREAEIYLGAPAVKPKLGCVPTFGLQRRMRAVPFAEAAAVHAFGKLQVRFRGRIRNLPQSGAREAELQLGKAACRHDAGHRVRDRVGCRQLRRGTADSTGCSVIFLDEIGETPLSLQPRLLRAIEAREVLPVGALKPRSIDVRFLAATNRDLEAEVVKGTFRRDLFFRLNTLTLPIPPLRDRTDEIPALVETFVDDACRESGRTPPTLSAEAMDYIQSYSWPGNIRELKNVIERALVLCDADEISAQFLPLDKMGAGSARTQGSEDSGPGVQRENTDRMAASTGPLPVLSDPEKAAERQRILDALTRHAGNQTRAAESLGMPRRTFITKLDAYGIARPQKNRNGNP